MHEGIKCVKYATPTTWRKENMPKLHWRPNRNHVCSVRLSTHFTQPERSSILLRHLYHARPLKELLNKSAPQHIRSDWCLSVKMLHKTKITHAWISTQWTVKFLFKPSRDTQIFQHSIFQHSTRLRQFVV